MGEHSEFEVAVYARHIEVTERYTDTQVQRFIRELRRLGVECELVFKSPCG